MSNIQQFNLFELCQAGEVRAVIDWIYEGCTAYASERLPLSEVAAAAVTMGQSICTTVTAEKVKRLNKPENYFLKSIQTAYADFESKQPQAKINQSIIRNIRGEKRETITSGG